jgi:hypothetical protein
MWATLWKIKLPCKLVVFLWKVYHNRLPVRMELIRRDMTVDSCCVVREGPISHYGMMAQIKFQPNNKTENRSRISIFYWCTKS